MNKRVVCMLSSLLVAGASSTCAFGQKWEFGGAVGGSFYTSQTVNNATAGNASAKIGPGMSASAWLGNTPSGRWGGEVRYDYTRGPLQLSGNGGNASFASQSHTIHYDAHLHLADAEAPIRPFIAVGAGARMFQGTGREVAAQPLSRVALLTKTTDLRPVVSVGFGVKARIADRWMVRAGVWNFMTPFPTKVIQPNTGSSVSGWLMNITPMVGISYLF